MRRLGDPWCFVDRGLWLKPFPTGSLGHPAMTKILELILEHDVTPDQVDKIRVRTRDGVLRTLAYHRPKRALEAKFSLEFCLATLLLERSLGLTHIDDVFVRRPEVQDLIGRTEYTPIPDAEARDGDYIPCRGPGRGLHPGHVVRRDGVEGRAPSRRPHRLRQGQQGQPHER